MNLNELIVSKEPLLVAEAFGFGRKRRRHPDGINLTPEQRARKDAQAAAAKKLALGPERLRQTHTPSDVPVVGTPPEEMPPTPLPQKPKHVDNGGVGPRFGDYLESGNGLWKIIGNDSANMVAFVQDPVSGEKQAVEWSDMIKDRDHNGKAIFTKG